MSKSTIHLTVDSGPKQGETLARAAGSLIRIGRVVRGNTLAIKDSSISQKHIVIEFDPQISRWALTDLATSNGTFINGIKVPASSSVHLSDGDVIKVGECSFISVKVVEVVEKGRRGRGRVLKQNEMLESKNAVLGSDLGDASQAKSLWKGTWRNSNETELREDLNKLGENGDFEDIKGQNCESKMTKDRGSKGGAKNVGKGKKRNIMRGLGLDDGSEEKYGRGKWTNCKIEDTENPNELGKIGDFEGTKDDSLGLVAEGGGAKEGLKNLGKGMKGNITRELGLDVESEENLGRGRRTNCKIEENENSNNLGKIGNFEGTKDRNCESEPVKDEGFDMVAEGGAKEGAKNVGRGRRRNLTKGAKKDEMLDLAVGTGVPDNVRRVERGNCSGVANNKVVEERMNIPKNLRRGRKGKSVKVSVAATIAEDDNNEPKNLERESTNSVQNLQKIPCLDLVIGYKSVKPDNMSEHKVGSSASILMDDEILEPISESFEKDPKKLGRGRRAKLSSVPKKDEVPEDIIDVPKTTGGRRRTRSAKLSEKDDNQDLVTEEKIQVSKNVGRGRTTATARALTLDTVAEEVTQVPNNIGRGKRKATSKVSKKGEMFDEVMKDNDEVSRNGGKGKPRRAPPRRMRASSSISQDGQLRPAEINMEKPLLNPIENLHESKVLRARSQRLSQSDKIQQIPIISSSPADLKDKESQKGEDKENYVSVLCHNIENDTTAIGPSCYEGIPDGSVSVSGTVATQKVEPRVFAKVWNGNCIPNTTTKYKEDQKVCWHATPFEVRLEKALSDDKLFPQRDLTS